MAKPAGIDTETTQINPGVGTGNDARLDRFEQIADNADALRAEDFDDLEAAALADADVQDEPQDDVPAFEDQHAEPLLTLKINGREVHMTQAEVIARAQKIEAADEYLKSAAALHRTAQQLAPSPQRDEPQQAETDPLALARAIQMGTEEEAAAAIQKLLRPSVTPDDVGRHVEAKLAFRDKQAEVEKAHARILTHDVLGTVFRQRLTALAAASPDLSLEDGYGQVAEGIRRDFAPLLEQRKPETKAERKAQMSTVPSAAGRQQSTSEDDYDDSPEAVIAELAASRAQGSPIRH
jgi:hypothetical protein